MGFVDPRTDFGFKRIFGSDRSKPILRNFLNAIIYDDEPRITDLEILDPYQNPDLYNLKQSILDIRAVLNDNTIVIVEMQVLPVKAFTERIVYNTAKAYTSQLKRGQGYRFLKPVISLTILDFRLFPEAEDPNPNPISRYQLIDPTTGKRLSHHIELILAELPKLATTPEQFGTRSELWLYFIQQAGRLETVPEFFADAEFDEAFAVANESQLSPEEYELAERQRMKIWDERDQQEYALEVGHERGLEEGRQQGLEEGREAGRAEGIEMGRSRGREEGLIEAARGMLLAGLDVETVGRATGLATAMVQELAAAIATDSTPEAP